MPAPLAPGNSSASSFCAFITSSMPCVAPQQEIVLRIRIDDARNVGVDDGSAGFLQRLDRIGHRLGLRLVQAAARLLLAGRREAIVETCARDADAGALQPISLEERPVV